MPRRVRPSAAPSWLPPVYAVADYADELRALLISHKERGALRLAAPLGAALAGAVNRLRSRCDTAPPPSPGARGDRADRGGRVAEGGGEAERPLLLLPVPSARAAVARRGHDPVRRMALAAARTLRRQGRPARTLPVLRQRRPVADQAGLPADERRVNLHGALEVVPAGVGLLSRGLARGDVVLVDDLVTTGASLTEAARAVAVRCGQVSGAAVLAVRQARGRGY